MDVPAEQLNDCLVKIPLQRTCEPKSPGVELRYVPSIQPEGYPQEEWLNGRPSQVPTMGMHVIVSCLVLFPAFEALFFPMTRFAAYSSDGSTDGEDDKPQATVFSSKNAEDSEDSESESSSSSSSDDSEMLEDELMSSSPPRIGTPRNKDYNALVEDENGDMRYAQEMGRRASPGSASSRSSPGTKTQSGYRGDPSVIPWAQRVGVDTQKLHVMQASLFRSQEEATALNHPVERKLPELKIHGGRKHRRDSDGDALKFDSREVSRHTLYHNKS